MAAPEPTLGSAEDGLEAFPASTGDGPGGLPESTRHNAPLLTIPPPMVSPNGAPTEYPSIIPGSPTFLT